jgi:hypothetical protein
MPSEGGSPIQITTGGGLEPFESPDGRLLFYAKGWGPQGIWSVPVGGGKETCVIERSPPSFWAVADQGIYFLDFTAARDGAVPLMLFRFKTAGISKVAAIAKVEYTGDPSFSVTRDGRWAAWAQSDRNESTLMLIENLP